MSQGGSEVAVRRVTINGIPLSDGTLNGIATSTDPACSTTSCMTIYVTAAGPGQIGMVLALPAF